VVVAWSSPVHRANVAKKLSHSRDTPVAERFSYRNNGKSRRWFDWRMTQA